MFACILYGFAMGFSSLRNLESSCLYDVRLLALMGLERGVPSSGFLSSSLLATKITEAGKQLETASDRKAYEGMIRNLKSILRRLLSMKRRSVSAVQN